MVVAGGLAQVMVMMVVAGHGGWGHRTELVRVVVRVHRCQVGTTIHSSKVGGRWGRVALGIPRSLTVGHRIGSRRRRAGALHAGGASGS